MLVCSDSRSVVSYINHHSGLVSKRLCTLVNNLLVWAQNNLHSLKATHVLGKMNQGADMLSRNNVSSEEWTLHPLAVQRIWEVFGKARVDLFASETTLTAKSFLQRARMPWPMNGPAFRSMLSSQSLCYRRYSGESGNNGTS